MKIRDLHSMDGHAACRLGDMAARCKIIIKAKIFIVGMMAMWSLTLMVWSQDVWLQ